MLLRSAGGVLTATVAGAYWYRPIPSEWGDEEARSRQASWASPEILADEPYTTPGIVHAGRLWLTPLIITMSRVFLRLANTFEVQKDANYESFLDAVTARSSATPLITVSNHRSLMDDPPLLSNILPYHVGIQPRYLRYGACAQEFCYPESLPGIIYAFMGSGRSMPIKRGGGINQKMWRDFARHAAVGQWIHIFPEAGIWQHEDGRLGGRDNPGWRGKLKWGIGKLVAHSPVPPVIIPFHHMGMEHIMPQDRHRKTISIVPKTNAHVTVKFGESIHVDDLIEEHEKEHGPLRKYSPSSSWDKLSKLLAGSDSRAHAVSHDELELIKDWSSSSHEKILYNKITARIEEALDRLGERANAGVK